MKIFLQKSKTLLLRSWRRIYARVRAFFIKEIELSGQRLTGLEYRNIGATAATVGVTGIVTIALVSGVSLIDIGRWIGFLPQEARSATLSQNSGGNTNPPPSEKPRRPARSLGAKFEIVEHSLSLIHI